MKNFLIENCFAKSRFLVETLMEEVKPVVTKIFDFPCREVLLTTVQFREAGLSRIQCKEHNQSFKNQVVDQKRNPFQNGQGRNKACCY